MIIVRLAIMAALMFVAYSAGRMSVARYEVSHMGRIPVLIDKQTQTMKVIPVEYPN